MDKTRITSWSQLQTDLPEILERLNRDSALTFAAAANPVLALEELGYDFDPAFRIYLTDRLRFGETGTARLAELRTDITRLAGRTCDLDDLEDIKRLLFDELRLSTSKESHAHLKKAVRHQELDHCWKPEGAGDDPLQALSGTHPLVQLLLEYRQIEASQPRMAPRKLYHQLRQTQVSLPISNLHASLNPQVARSRKRSK